MPVYLEFILSVVLRYIQSQIFSTVKINTIESSTFCGVVSLFLNFLEKMKVPGTSQGDLTFILTV